MASLNDDPERARLCMSAGQLSRMSTNLHCLAPERPKSKTRPPDARSVERTGPTDFWLPKTSWEEDLERLRKVLESPRKKRMTTPARSLDLESPMRCSYHSELLRLTRPDAYKKQSAPPGLTAVEVWKRSDGERGSPI